MTMDVNIKNYFQFSTSNSRRPSMSSKQTNGQEWSFETVQFDPVTKREISSARSPNHMTSHVIDQRQVGIGFASHWSLRTTSTSTSPSNNSNNYDNHVSSTEQQQRQQQWQRNTSVRSPHQSTNSNMIRKSNKMINQRLCNNNNNNSYNNQNYNNHHSSMTSRYINSPPCNTTPSPTTPPVYSPLNKTQENNNKNNKQNSSTNSEEKFTTTSHRQTASTTSSSYSQTSSEAVVSSRTITTTSMTTPLIDVYQQMFDELERASAFMTCHYGASSTGTTVAGMKSSRAINTNEEESRGSTRQSVSIKELLN